MQKKRETNEIPLERWDLTQAHTALNILSTSSCRFRIGKNGDALKVHFEITLYIIWIGTIVINAFQDNQMIVTLYKHE